MIKIFQEENQLRLAVSGTDFTGNIQLIKSITGRKFNPQTKFWYVPDNAVSREALKGYFDGDSDEESEFEIDQTWKQIPIDAPDFMYHFQKDSLRYVKRHNNRALLGLPMGSGKTLIALSFILSQSQDRPSLVICPASVKRGFERDYKKFFPNETKQITLLKGINSLTYYSEPNIYVVNYEILSRNIVKTVIEYKTKYGKTKTRTIFKPSENLLQFISSNFNTIIVDECHKLKNKESQIYQAFTYLQQETKNVIAMSGTPILSKPSDLWPMMSILQPEVFSHEYWYLNRFCNPTSTFIGKGRRITTYNGVTRPKELNALLMNNGMLVYNKQEIMPELPEFERIVVPLECENVAEYLEYREELLGQIAKNPSMALAMIEKLKQAAVNQKMAMVYDFIDNFIESGEKFPVFAIHQYIVDAIADRYKEKAVKFYGNSSDKQKEQSRISFIEDPNVQIIVGNIQSLGTGVDGLQKSGASFMLTIELPWNPAEMDQADSRLYRSGYTQDRGIKSYVLVAEETIEAEIVEKLDLKKDTTHKVLVGESADSTSLLQYLIDTYKEEAENRKVVPIGR
jgi:SWI/SNF-related matrix-associated actin-dependent regulator 1 of chromatin subfamily A